MVNGSGVFSTTRSTIADRQPMNSSKTNRRKKNISIYLFSDDLVTISTSAPENFEGKKRSPLHGTDFRPYKLKIFMPQLQTWWQSCSTTTVQRKSHKEKNDGPAAGRPFPCELRLTPIKNTFDSRRGRKWSLKETHFMPLWFYDVLDTFCKDFHLIVKRLPCKKMKYEHDF